MKSILMSIQSKWLAKILNGEKTVELRKRFPKDYRGWVYLYCTKAIRHGCLVNMGYNEPSKKYIFENVAKRSFVDLNNDFTTPMLNGKVVARYWCENVEKIDGNVGHQKIYVNACIGDEEACKYANGKNLYAIHISKLKIFDKPKELNEFCKEEYAVMPNGIFPSNQPLTKAPQSWQYIYIEEDK